MASGRVGPGVTAHPGAPPEVLAERVAALQAAAKRSHAERKAAARAWLEGCTTMTLEELRRSTPARLWSVAMLHLGGYDAAAIARAIGYTTQQAGMKALRHPAVQRIVALVRDAQLERVLRGEYGVAAPAVMEHVAELAGGVKDKASGERRGRAKRDADAIRAADLLLTTSGDKVARTAHLHLHVLEQLSDSELEAFSARGEWPERLAGVVGMLPGPEGTEP